MPRFSILSDGHLEHETHTIEATWYRENEADAAILAGDMARPDDVAAWCEDIGLPSVHVMGNHEPYGRDLDEVRMTMRALAEAFDNTYFLDRDTAIIDAGDVPVRFIGVTLWTDYCLFGEENKNHAMQVARRLMNDHRTIMKGGTPFMPEDAAREHAFDRRFLEQELNKPFPEGPTVVVTHHAPSIRCQPEIYNNSPLAPAFCNDMEDFVAWSGADLWVCGHTHGDADFIVGNTRVVTNQHGYHREKTVEMKTVDVSAV